MIVVAMAVVEYWEDCGRIYTRYEVVATVRPVPCQPRTSRGITRIADSQMLTRGHGFSLARTTSSAVERVEYRV